MLFGTAWLVAPAPFDARYADDDGDSLRALLGGCEIAVLAQVLSGDELLSPP